MRRRSPPLLRARRHGVVLAWPFLRALALAAAGTAGLLARWPVPVAGALALALAALVALRAAWRWERTLIVVTDGELAVVDGTLRRRVASVSLPHAGAIEVEQSLPGRLLGYGTVVAGDLEVPYVARPRELVHALRRA